MADISMCNGVGCPSKEMCHRYTAKPSDFWQSYADFTVKKGEDKCDYFWDNKDYEDERPKNINNNESN